VKTTVAVAVLALVLAGNALGSSKHVTWKSMTLNERLVLVNHTISVHRPPVRAWIHNHARVPVSAAGPTVMCRAIGVRAPGAICVHAQRLVRALKVRARIKRHLAEAALRARLSAFPPHHALWTCISRFEGSPTSINPNGHYGMLQMHAGWGYGTSYHASDDPQAVQEWAAERAYAANHYSTSFLYGQWFDYDGAAGTCLRYA